MVVNVPAQIPRRSFLDDSRDQGEIRGYVMFEAVRADVLEHLLQVWNLDDAGTAKRHEGIVSEAPFADIPARSGRLAMQPGRLSHLRPVLSPFVRFV